MALKGQCTTDWSGDSNVDCLDWITRLAEISDDIMEFMPLESYEIDKYIEYNLTYFKDVVKYKK